MPEPVPVASSSSSKFPDDEGIDYSDIEAKYEIPYEDGFDSVLVIDNIPIVDAAKKDRLVTAIHKRFAQKGCPVKEGGLHVCWDDSAGKSKGYIFAEFASRDEATHALATMNGFPFDAKHTFAINWFTDIEKFVNLNETYVEPKIPEFKPKEHLRWWLGDPQGRDQFLTYRQDDVAIHWHSKTTSDVVVERRNWTDLFTAWSPLGTYLASIHRPGIKLWGGESWSDLGRFAHPLVKLIDFSPNENYLVTWSQEAIVLGTPGSQFTEEDEGNNLAVWDVKTGRLLRTFPAVPEALPTADGAPAQKKTMPWPAMKWSPDDRYAARVTVGQQISVYELPGMGLLGKKSHKVDGVMDFEWCPLGDKDHDDAAKEKAKKGGAAKEKESVMAYWTPEISNQPARVTLLGFPSRTVLRVKNLFNVSDCKLHWQNQGDYLCVKVDRHTKTKKSIFCNLEIFRLREKDFPVEVIELKDTVTDFAWEPKGERFAIVTSSDPNLGNVGPGITIKTEVVFYQLDRAGKGDFRLLKTLNNKTSNTIRWSPKGRHVVLVTVGSSSKFDLEFWDLDFLSDDRKDATSRAAANKEDWGTGVQLLATTEHYGVTDIEWDPSGRFVATSASAWRHSLENGYYIWDFRGQELQKHILDRFKQFLWRPRPRTLLSKEQQKAIRKNLKEYSRVFDEEDAAEESSASKELVAHRKRLVDEWNAWRARIKSEVASSGASKKGKEKEEEVREEIEEWIEEVLEETIEVLES
ncbi:Translation initiation factor 3 subunit b [Tulasnella sp. 419]|nr:Translation initiation factor 3 subunit b [Tulasnella sp. 418]KAG8967032.1 Translation initiation factor 3 subunit b [Tulasnella sp. 419]